EPGTSPGLPAAPPHPHPDLPDDFLPDSSNVATEPEPSPASTMPGHTPAPALRDSEPRVTPPSISNPSFAPPVAAPMARPSAPPPVTRPNAPVEAGNKSKLPVVLLTMLLVAGLGAGGYYVYTTQFAKKETTDVAGTGSAKTGSAKTTTGSAGSAVVATATPDAAPEMPAATPDAATQVATATPDAAAVPTATPDAATQVATATPDAATGNSDNGTNNVTTPSGASDKLEIASNPKGAHIYIDGADQGATPLKLPGSTDRHSIAAFVPGYDLYLGEVDGHGVFNLELKPIEKFPKAFGGIKVLKCKTNRYYIYVDGKPTGQTCPSERINVLVGPHTVEVYDLVSESRRKFNITVKDEGASERIRLE
ncbi:MAG TPA: PEGA domain-containing protein, partial [Kofleriaceae bacterium]|nr:PEGA domain-containing protein [Kofleriaceae bacterium]